MIQQISKKILEIENLSKDPAKVKSCIQFLKNKIAENEKKINDLTSKIINQEIYWGSKLLIDNLSPEIQYVVPEIKKQPVVVVKEEPKPQAKVETAPKVAEDKKAKTAKQNDSKVKDKAPAPALPPGSVCVSQLNFRIGKIIEISKHPDADSLYVEKVDLGEATPRTIVSGLVKYVSKEKLESNYFVFLCNLKPAKMRGVESQGMLMCASDAEGQGVEPLMIKCDDVKPGARIIIPSKDGPPEAVLNPKKKIFEQLKPMIRTSKDGIACFDGVPFIVEGHTNSSIYSNLKDVQIS